MNSCKLQFCQFLLPSILFFFLFTFYIFPNQQFYEFNLYSLTREIKVSLKELVPSAYLLLVLLKFSITLWVLLFCGILLLPYFWHFLLKPQVLYHLIVLFTTTLNLMLLVLELLACILLMPDPAQYIFNEVHHTLIKILQKFIL